MQVFYRSLLHAWPTGTTLCTCSSSAHQWSCRLIPIHLMFKDNWQQSPLSMFLLFRSWETRSHWCSSWALRLMKCSQTLDLQTPPNNLLPSALILVPFNHCSTYSASKPLPAPYSFQPPQHLGSTHSGFTLSQGPKDYSGPLRSKTNLKDPCITPSALLLLRSCKHQTFPILLAKWIRISDGDPAEHVLLSYLSNKCLLIFLFTCLILHTGLKS